MVHGLWWGLGTGDVLAADASDRCGASCVLSHSPCIFSPPGLATALPVAAAIPACSRVGRVWGSGFGICDLCLATCAKGIVASLGLRV
jgi:hypothetical protein